MLWIYHFLQYTFIKYIYDQISLNSIQPYVENVNKSKQYIWFILHHSFIYLHTYISYSYSASYLNNSTELLHSNIVHPYVTSLYELEKAIYLYDTIVVIYQRDLVFILHHAITLMALINSEKNNLMNVGTYVLFIMNSTSINLYIARLLRQLKDTRFIIVGDTVFLSLFVYFRIWRLSLLFITNLINLNIYFKPYVLLLFIWLLQFIWFIKLSKIYYINHIENTLPSSLYFIKPSLKSPLKIFIDIQKLKMLLTLKNKN